MGCLLPLFSIITPRFVMVILWLFTTYLERAYGSFWVPLLGFIFLPTTTIAYAIAQNALGGVGTGGGVIVLVVGLLFDLGFITGSTRGWRPGRKRAAD